MADHIHCLVPLLGISRIVELELQQNNCFLVTVEWYSGPWLLPQELYPLGQWTGNEAVSYLMIKKFILSFDKFLSCLHYLSSLGGTQTWEKYEYCYIQTRQGPGKQQCQLQLILCKWATNTSSWCSEAKSKRPRQVAFLSGPLAPAGGRYHLHGKGCVLSGRSSARTFTYESTIPQ